MSLKVLYITHYSDFYGANRSLLQLIDELKENFHVKPVVIVPKEGDFVDELRSRNIPIFKYRYYNWLNLEKDSKKSVIKKILNRVCFWYIKINIFKDLGTNIDLIHTNSSATHLGGYLSKIFKIPHLWQIREYGYLDYNLVYYNGIKKATDFIEKNSSKVVVISKDLKNYYSKHINPNKIKVIYNGIKEQPLFEKRKIPSKILNLCFVGAISENKNQIEAIKACEYLIKNKGVNNLLFHIVGSGTPEYVNYLKEYVLNKGLQKNVKFIGYLKNVNDFLKNMGRGDPK